MTDTLYRIYEGDWLANEYYKHRPTYPKFIPEKILEYIGRDAKNPSKNGTMIDLGCGSGQATHIFAKYFEKLVGFDISEGQIRVANEKNENKNVSFEVMRDNLFPIGDTTCDLVTSATAAHWFDMDIFQSECDRVLKPGGAVAVFTYMLLNTKPITGGEGDKEKFLEAIFKFITESGGHSRSKKKGYEEIFEAIKNRSKEWVTCPYHDQEYTVKSFKEMMTTLGEYPTYMAGNPEVDPMVELGESIKKIVGEEGKNDEDVKFYLTYGYQLILYKKK